MGHTVGYEGLVSSWSLGGTRPVDVSKFGPATVNFTVPGDEFDATVLAASLEAMTYIPGLKQWSVQMSARFPASAAQIGSAGNVTLSGYDLLIRAYTLAWACPAFAGTVFSASGVTWRAFTPGLYSWNGTLEAGIDGSTALGLPPAPAAAAGSLTLKVTEDGATDRAFTGSAFVRQTSGVIAVGALNTAQYTYRGTGALTSVGTNNIWAAGSIVKPVAGSLVFQAASGRTFTGDAFPTNVTLSVAVDGLIDVSVTAQGTGSLTLA